MRAAALIERLYARQRGTLGMEASLVPGDTASAALFFRNQGPFCVAPRTEKNPDCSALPTRPTPVFGLYPPEIQKDRPFCELLQKQVDAKQLLDHFNVVVGGLSKRFRTMKYSEAFGEDMARVAGELEAAAVGLVPAEATLVNYLHAAAHAFRDNEWERANEAWLAMGGGSSKYHLRVAPDEVYYEPCASKAGFALTFGRVNQESAEWRQRLEPIKQEMEDELARLAGPPYQARQVRFKLPDFVDIVLNAGNERSALKVTAGQSLPNWGPVARRQVLHHGGGPARGRAQPGTSA
jgi:hypothetical protein